jgi:hypothetical protein
VFDGTGITSDFCERAETNPHAHEKCEKSANDGELHACTLRTPQPDDKHQSGHPIGASRPLRSDVEDDLTIPPILDRRDEVCAQCGRPGGAECAYDGVTVRLHPECWRAWRANYEASRARQTRSSQ